MFSRETVFITGGTGSFGRAMLEYLLDLEKRPSKIIIFSRDEMKQSQMRQNGFDDPIIRYFIGDVRDLDRLRRAMDGVDIVIHAAALKQVPACEYNPFEAVKTNIGGARNVIIAALENDVKQVIALSTDKASAPATLYGGTKFVAEKLFVHGNVYTGHRAGPRFSVVRYGNVIGSRGSVIPLFLKQRESGVLTITDAHMTRFWITLDQAVSFVARCLELMIGGEIFVPVLPAMSIAALAKAIAPEATIETTGVRPGEKIHEVLISPDEARSTIRRKDMFVLLPAEGHARDIWMKDSHSRPLGHEKFYTSADPERWLSIERMREMVKCM